MYNICMPHSNYVYINVACDQNDPDHFTFLLNNYDSFDIETKHTQRDIHVYFEHWNFYLLKYKKKTRNNRELPCIYFINFGVFFLLRFSHKLYPMLVDEITENSQMTPWCLRCFWMICKWANMNNPVFTRWRTISRWKWRLKENYVNLKHMRCLVGWH